MKYFFKFFVLCVALMITGCSYSTIPPATKAKILSGQGYSQEVYESGKKLVWWWERLVILDTSTTSMSESVTVKTNDKLDLTFEIRFRARIGGTDNAINAMFNDITVQNNSVTMGMVYNVYGKDVVQSIGRSVMSRYVAEEIPANFENITKEIQNEMSIAFQNSPLEMSYVTLGAIQYPRVITEAIEKQAERRLAIETENNQQAIEMVKRANQQKLAEADYQIRMTQAKAIRDENNMISEGLNPIFLQYRALEVQSEMAKNGSTVFFPYEAMTNIGLHNRVFSK